MHHALLGDNDNKPHLGLCKLAEDPGGLAVVCCPSVDILIQVHHSYEPHLGLCKLVGDPGGLARVCWPSVDVGRLSFGSELA